MKKDQKVSLATAVSLALLLLSCGNATAKMGKCYGVVKSGENDCSIGTETTCKGTETIDYDPRGWVVMNEEGCLAKHKELVAEGTIDNHFKWEGKG